MSLQFVIGKASQDHRRVMLAQLGRQLDADPEGHFFYLIPNHIKFSSEVAILNALQQRQAKTSMVYAEQNVQVFSFSRLAWHFMKNTPYYQLPRLDKAGLNMLMYQTVTQHAAELTIFRGELTQPGFIAQLVDQLMNLKTGCVTSEDLQAIGEKLDPKADIAAKVADLAVIYQAFDAAMAGRYVANTDLLNALSDYLAQEDLSHSYFYIEGFAQLSAQEYRLLTTLLTHAAKVTVSLTLDQAYTNELPTLENLFFQSGKVYHQLYQTARRFHIPIATDLRAQQPRVSAGLQQLENYWIQSTNGGNIQSETLTQATTLQLMCTDTRYAEVMRVATKIRQMVALEGYHYRDFLVLTRHLDAYETILAPIFQKQQIPYFDDLQHSMVDHPLVELINALFAVKDHFYRYQDMMRLLKTELFLPKVQGKTMALEDFRQAVDLTENMVLKFGFTGKQWLRKDDWQYYRFDEQDFGTVSDRDQVITKQVNIIRNFIKQSLPPLFKKLDQVKTGSQAVVAIYQFLVKWGVPDQLLNWRDQAVERGDLTAAAQPEQTWQTFCSMLDEYVTILGDSDFDSANFLALFQAGFQGASYSQIPSTLDQVLVSETGIVQTDERKVIFMIGATNLVMPDRIGENQLLSDSDQEKLTATLPAEHYLPDGALAQMAFEPYLNYLAFLSGKERLIFTYPMTGDDGASLQPSPYVERIRRYFHLTWQYCPTRPQLTANKIATYVGSKRSALTNLIQISRDAIAQKKELPVAWLYVYRRLRQDPNYQQLTAKLMASLNYRNIPVQLKPDIVTSLYGKSINTSISKLEEFYQNEYAYFLKYGLKLRERDVFELSPASTGEFYHMALDHLLRQVQADGRTIAELKLTEIDHLVDHILNEMRELPQFQILNSSNRMAYIARQLAGTVKQMSHALQHQGQKSRMAPLRTEVLFGHVGSKEGLKSLDFNLPQGRAVHVRGKIDRIDQLVVGQERYLGIVDYKSSEHKFSFSDAYYGLALQMLTYLDAMKKNVGQLADGNAVKLAGALYMHLQNPKLKLKDVLSKGFDDALLATNKYDGILLNDLTLLDNLDQDLADKKSGYSQVYPLYKKASGGYSPHQSNLVTESELELLLQHNETLIRQAAQGIFNGDLKLNPVKWPDNHTALQYSPYKSIFQFDAMLPENNYHQLNTLQPEDVVAMLAAEKRQRKED
ncbi:ATP-dependent helicase [Loigolactobacillus backii]|uniref:PD-(D/E)XK nuclease family protein n=1 Tax=Loigolactobacillus backii TaxID=375175 RepID=UPI0007F1155C|nr:PD-(D/E)XK nuclease family protein [Loigolactobacillus backii]ANK58848.1 ATP-dependent helicase [Loigolactobacillus backii]ANK63838.1 ATP-dependent helicase [Loigolactobacillus backii]ANK66286.1 ATP-dependent helicase [Loigolactobacillus backii]OLF69122.1 ATP-dependent helicase [Loigolactobacillus backii]PIO86436.1 ATP-dependent helicase [Loigolactobacillus backii]